ncbi:glucans biosynthesis protein G [Azorhizobium oxalatiphilum]|uniref:Glucans biosynthesis protein G n=1 Tax=Azorhizobium oxalatiphilum TaxID=980631 RepID=A0A917BLS7_9HYPH|nr:glucan biosynthesis protein G [Azorhizobium oxalatiphilum]GGF48522.1 glucans biosynthesis protein G [Azorhizobium oxalatiphilum]
MDRRHVLKGAAALPLLAAMSGTAWQALVAEAKAQDAQGMPFSPATVRQMARELAQKPYQAADTKLPPELDKLSYDDYRNIRFKPEASLWRKEQLPFEMQLLHRGFLFRDRVDIALVEGGKARQLRYSQDYFRFDNKLPAPDPKLDLGFSGFRLHAPMNRKEYYDEVVVFQGASYFRAIAKDQIYGASARGLSIKTGDQSGEEFPIFKAFWVEVPGKQADSCVVHALLDSPSASAAFRFTIRPGETTSMATEMTVYPRGDVDQVGLGTLTSMFLFGPNDRNDVDDFRPAVRDNEGLAIINGGGERIWRPLTNPQRLEVSSFMDTNTRGFGLMQRQRSFFDYQDLEARYEKRPSVWVEPIGDWGEGSVILLEIPTKEEIHDNIVTFWRPKEPLRKGGEYNYVYRMHWGWNGPDDAKIARFTATRQGAAPSGRQFVLDVIGPNLEGIAPDALRADVTASGGEVRSVVLQPNPDIKGYRLAFVLDPKNTSPVEIRAVVMKDQERMSETWVYRWTA